MSHKPILGIMYRLQSSVQKVVYRRAFLIYCSLHFNRRLEWRYSSGEITRLSSEHGVHLKLSALAVIIILRFLR